MKKIVIIQVLSLFFTNLLLGQTHYGLNTSLVFSSGKIIQPSLTNASETPKENKKFVSAKAGLSLTSRISSSFLFLPEINFINKGATAIISKSYPSYVQTFTTKYNLLLLEVPLNVAYNKKLNDDVFFGVGPVISLGLGGNVKTKVSYAGLNPEVKYFEQKIFFDGKKVDTINFSKDNEYHLSKIEIGLNAFVGVFLTESYYLKLNYSKSFTNLQPNKNFMLRTNYLGIACGFLFRKPIKTN